MHKLFKIKGLYAGTASGHCKYKAVDGGQFMQNPPFKSNGRGAFWCFLSKIKTKGCWPYGLDFKKKSLKMRFRQTHLELLIRLLEPDE